MQNNTDSIRRQLENFSHWLKLEETQWLLQQLKELGADKTTAVINNVPQTRGEEIQREQNIGFAQGLFYAESLINSQIQTLKQELEDKPNKEE